MVKEYIAIQSNKINHNNFIKRLVKEGYKEGRWTY